MSATAEQEGNRPSSDVSDLKRLDRELRESEERFRVVLLGAPVVVFEQDRELRYTWVHNPHPGFDPRQVLGRTDADLLPEEDAAALTTIKRGVLLSGQGTRQKVRATIAGLDHDYDLTVEPRFDGSGQVVGITCAAWDITERERAEHEQRRISRQNELLLRSAAEGIYGLDRRGRTTFVNPAAATMLGYAPAELLGRPMHPLLHHARADGSPYPEVECPIHFTLADGQVHTVSHEVFWRRDGTLLPVEYTSTPIVEQGQVAGAVVTFRDISARLRAERERTEFLAREQAARAEAERARDRLARLQSVTAALSEAVTAADIADVIVRHGLDALAASAGSVVRLVPSGDELEVLGAKGYPRELLERWQRFPLDLPLPLNDAVRSGQAVWLGSRAETLARYPRFAEAGPPGHSAWATLPLVAEGRSLGGLGLSFADEQVFSDADRAFALALASECARALDRAAAYGAAEEARAVAEEAVRAREAVLNSVTHDLGNPLTTILGYMTLLERQVSFGATDAQSTAEVLEKLRASALKMRALISELLDAARLQAGEALELNRQPTDLVALAGEAIATLAEQGGHVEARLEARAGALVGQWDRRRLERVLENLLSNAAKYSPGGGEVVVGVERRGGWAVLRVRDRGVGIPAADLPRVFERFHRAGNVRGRLHGTGLGLWGARRIAEQHGGAIELESREGQGTTVTLRLPL